MLAGGVVHDATVELANKNDVRSAGERQRDGEGAAGAGIVPDADRAVVLLDDPAGDRQAEPGAVVRAGRVSLVKALEDSLPIVRRAPRAIVGDGQQHSRVVLPEPNLHGATWLGELCAVI